MRIESTGLNNGENLTTAVRNRLGSDISYNTSLTVEQFIGAGTHLFVVYADAPIVLLQTKSVAVPSLQHDEFDRPLPVKDANGDVLYQDVHCSTCILAVASLLVVKGLDAVRVRIWTTDDSDQCMSARVAVEAHIRDFVLERASNVSVLTNR